MPSFCKTAAIFRSEACGALQRVSWCHRPAGSCLAQQAPTCACVCSPSELSEGERTGLYRRVHIQFRGAMSTGGWGPRSGTQVTHLGSLMTLLWARKETVSLETVVLSVVSKRLRTQWEESAPRVLNAVLTYGDLFSPETRR